MKRKHNGEDKEDDLKDKKLSEKQRSKLPEYGSDIAEIFHNGLLDTESILKLTNEYSESIPYKHCVIDGLINEDILKNVRNEISKELHFSLRETDIYKINQTGDLANLSGLNNAEIKRLPSLFQLRNGLYSNVFRKFISTISGCGPLSGSKQDMSITLYTKGCHLLNHDDVIGTRRVSYILYLPDPNKEWKTEWGGALRLYPTIYPNVPIPDPTIIYPPKWNQFAFFTVQPGHSFHDVEEVYVDEPRYAISGWFHIPQVGEEGYKEQQQQQEGGKDSAATATSKSTLEALSCDNKKDDLYKFEEPKLEFSQLQLQGDGNEEDLKTLTNNDIKYLSKYLNPILLTKNAIIQLNEYFIKTSHLEIKEIFCKKFAKKLFNQVEKLDVPEYKEKSWGIAKPPYKHRFLYLNNNNNGDDDDDDEKYINEISHLVGKSIPFIKWIGLITGGLLPNKSRVLARKFRPGHDYTLASSQYNNNDQILELCIGITPSTIVNQWPNDVGGYQVYIRGDNGESDDDPAIYIDPNVKKLLRDDDDDDGTSTGSSSESESDNESQSDDDDDDDDDNVLISNPPSWNSLSLTLRDSGILKFVKYTSKLAPGSRFDIIADYNFNLIDQSDSDQSDDTTSSSSS